MIKRLGTVRHEAKGAYLQAYDEYTMYQDDSKLLDVADELNAIVNSIDSLISNLRE